MPPILKAAPVGLVSVAALVAAALVAPLVAALSEPPPQAARLSIMPAASTKLITFLFMCFFSFLIRISIQKSGSANM